ncbi:MAG: hypothetical protein EZS28_052138 [Streblomastix strix]|uniref:Resolvase HTH domain-containing protein n=1 Tax=Streblomastix strix TaxID=222440 RepID=A0A5J4SIP4_9EUKA|nr:MAG: hypothetical protein EZS28_052138 [Streblomastix strix]
MPGPIPPKTQKEIRKLHSLGKKVRTISRLVKVDKNTVSLYIAKKKIKVVHKISKRLGRHKVITSKVGEKVKNQLAQKNSQTQKIGKNMFTQTRRNSKWTDQMGTRESGQSLT